MAESSANQRRQEMKIREFIDISIRNWATLRHPALMERFLLAQGKEYVPGPRVGRKMTPKQCFRNAAHVALRKAEFTYVEGYMWSDPIPLLIHHAWLTPDGKTVMDPTVDSAGRQYWGIPFSDAELTRELARIGTYGILDTGFGINTELMFERMPSLKILAESICKMRNPSLVNEERRE